MFTSGVYPGQLTTSAQTERWTRIRLAAHEPLRLGRSSFHIRVVSGDVWVTFEGKDIFLTKGDQLFITPSKNSALISSIRNTPIVLDLSRIEGQR